MRIFSLQKTNFLNKKEPDKNLQFHNSFAFELPHKLIFSFLTAIYFSD